MCADHPLVTEGNMMRSPAIHYAGKVFAFFSRKHKMVFKLGTDHSFNVLNVPLSEFNPFKNKKPLTGWYELDFEHHEKWELLAQAALEKIKLDTHGK